MSGKQAESTVFDSSPHRCKGSHLARLELQVPRLEWHKRFPDCQPEPGVDMQYSIGVRSVETFRIELGVFA